MVDALREARRVLAHSGVLIDVRPVTAPIKVEVAVGAQPVWAKTVDTFSAPDDVAAADAAVQHVMLCPASGLSSRRVLRSTSTSIAIAPPS